MITDHQLIGIALDEFAEGVFPFFERELRDVIGERWEPTSRASLRSQATASHGDFHWDAQAILTVMWDWWNTVFRKRLGNVERSIVSELREFRNRWAHQARCSEEDCYRVLDSVQRLLVACGAEQHAARIEEYKIDVLRKKLGRRVNQEMARARFNRSRLVDTSLYTLCAFSIITLMSVAYGHRHPLETGLVVGFTLFAFCYLVYKRFQSTPPAYGVHECAKCGKVIYTENCPYCELGALRVLPNHDGRVSEETAGQSIRQGAAMKMVNRWIGRSSDVVHVE